MGEVRRKGNRPLYVQIKEILEKDIRKGVFQPGERFPTERELCERFGVSRITIRQALQELVKDGLLYRHQGSGSYVTYPSPVKKKELYVVVPEEFWIPPLRKAVRDYHNGHPGERLRVKVLVMGGPEFHAEIVDAVGKGEAPDMALIDWIRLTEFADMRYIEPLDELDAEWVESFKADILPIFAENSSYQGHFWGVQIDTTLAVLWYRKDILQREGVAPPKTWDELVLAAKHFQRESLRRRYGLGPFPIAFPGGPEAEEITTYILSAFIWSAGGEIVKEGKIVLDEGTEEALKFLYDLVHTHRLAPLDVVSYGWKTVPTLFAKGEVVFAFGGTYEKGLIQEITGWDESIFRERIGFAPIPAGPGGRPATTAGGMVYVIFRQSKYPGEALELLKAVSSPPLMLEFCRKTGRKPTRVSVTKALDPERDWFIYETSKFFELARVRPIIPQYVRVSEQLRLMLANVLLGKEGIDEAVDKAQIIIDALLS